MVFSDSFGWAVASVVNGVLLVVIQFANWYVSFGNIANWNRPLTRIDALQLSLGQLTTAGAPGITPTSELARRLMTTQLGVDILVAVVLFGLFVDRLATIRRT